MSSPSPLESPLSDFSSRLATLSTGSPGLVTQLSVSVSSPPPAGPPTETPPHRNTETPPHGNTDTPPHGNTETPEYRNTETLPHRNPSPAILDFVASDETLDRHGEIISAAGWDLTPYRRNPVFQNSHQTGDIIFTLGRALVTEVRQVDGRAALFQRIQFAVDANPFARIAHALYAGGFLHAVSIGMIPKRWENGTPQARYRRKFIEQELIELSAVAVPANPNALTQAFKSGAVAKRDIRELVDILRCALSTQPPARRQGLVNLQLIASLSRTLRAIAQHI